MFSTSGNIKSFQCGDLVISSSRPHKQLVETDTIVSGDAGREQSAVTSPEPADSDGASSIIASAGAPNVSEVTDVQEDQDEQETDLTDITGPIHMYTINLINI